MTICGVIARRDAAVAWADTEVFDRVNALPDPRCKLSINVRAGFALVAAGLEALAATAEAEVAPSAGLDDAAARMAGPLRRRADRLLREPGADPYRVAGSQILLVGRSKVCGRLAVYTLEGATLFHPIVNTRAASPWLPGLDVLDPHDLQAVAGFARRQLEALREDYPDAQGGTLTVALIAPGMPVVAGALFEFNTGAWLWPGLALAQPFSSTMETIANAQAC